MAGEPTGIIGTIWNKVGEKTPVVRTTPESLDLQAILAKMNASWQNRTMEVSSMPFFTG